ncbi:hypothetical protein Tco_1410914 [Tanacetum coccineum]
MEDDKETAELQIMMKVISDEEEVVVDAIPLATKPPSIGRIVGIKSLLEVTAVKIYEPEVKGTSSSSSNTQNVAFVSSKSTNSTNGAVNTAHGATTASTQAIDVNSTIIDNLKEMDLRWQMAMLTMRARRFLKNTRRKLTVNGTETIGLISPRWSVTTATKGGGYFERECRAPRNQENKNRENTRMVVPVETTTSNALISCDGLGDYDWSDQVEEVLKEQNEQLLKDFRKSKIIAITYKIGLESVEARLLVYKKNESVYEEDIKILKREIHLREVAITELRRKLELAQKKDEIQQTVEKYENSSKSLSKLIDCLIVDKCKTGLRYNDVLPPYTGNFIPPKLDLSFSGLEEFMNEHIVSEPTVKKHVDEAKASADKPKADKKNNGALIIKDWVSDSEEEDMPQAKIQKKIVKLSFAKIEFVKSKEQVKTPRKIAVKQDYGVILRCLTKLVLYGSFDHLQYDCNNHQRQLNNKKIVKPMWNYTERVNHQHFSRMTHPSPKRNMIPKAVLMRYGLVSLTTARPANTAQPRSTVNSTRSNVLNKAHSTVRRPINNKTTTKNSNFNQGVNNVKDKNVNTSRPKAVVNTAKPKAVLNVVKENHVNVVKASSCWVWNQRSKAIHKWIYSTKEVIDSGCSRHMTGNMSYLTDFEEIDGGYVAFRGNPKRGKSQEEIETVTWQKDYILLPLWTADPPFSQSSKSSPEKKVTKEARKEGGDSSKDSEGNDQENEDNVNNTNNVNAASTNEVNAVGAKTSIEFPDDLNMHELEDIVYSDDDADVGAEADMNNLDAFMPVSPILTTRIHKDHLVEQIIGDLNLAPQTRRMTKNLEEHGSGYQQKDRKPSQNDKTEHGMEKTVQNQGQSPKMPKSESILKNQQSNRSQN